MFFAVRLERGGPWDWSRDLREQDGWDEHAQFMDALVDSGFVVFGGPLAGDREILHAVSAASEEAVRERLAEATGTRTACSRSNRSTLGRSCSTAGRPNRDSRFVPGAAARTGNADCGERSAGERSGPWSATALRRAQPRSAPESSPSRPAATGPCSPPPASPPANTDALSASRCAIRWHELRPCVPIARSLHQPRTVHGWAGGRYAFRDPVVVELPSHQLTKRRAFHAPRARKRPRPRAQRQAQVLRKAGPPSDHSNQLLFGQMTAAQRRFCGNATSPIK